MNFAMPSCEEIHLFLQTLSDHRHLQPTQRSVCGKRIQENIKRLINNEIPPRILTAGNRICNGHHRYIAGLMYQMPPLSGSWTIAGSTVTHDWKDVFVDCGQMWKF